MSLFALIPILLQATASDPLPPRPATPPASWIAARDYPLEALTLGSEGVTAFALEVDAQGKAANCRITASSGSAVLDAQTCRLAEARARFAPGRPGTYASRVRWVLPLPRAFEPGRMDVRYLIGMDGAVERCEVVSSEGAAPADPCAARAPRFLPFTDGEGRPVTRWVRHVVTFELEPVK